MTAEELQEVKQYVLRELPQALAEDREIVLVLEGILAERFPSRDEFARLLDEVQASRRENQQRFNEVDQRFDQVDQRFTGVDQRLDGTDQRFDRIDQRFDGMDQRLDQMDQRFDGMDQRFDGMDQRLDRMDQRFDGMDQRFDGMDQRFVRVEQRLESVEQGLGAVRLEIVGLRDWMELNVGGFQTKAGRRLEDVVAGALRYGLGQSDIQPEHVRLRQKFIDTEGLVFRPGREREVDIIVLGPRILVFEVKAGADLDDIEDLADKVTLVKHAHPNRTVDGILVMLGAERVHRAECERRGLKLIP